jgi:transposase
MASKFLVPDRDQSFFEEVSFRERLGEDHVVWTIIDVVDRLDLSVIYGRYRPDTGGGGRPALDPKMLLVLLMFGYSEGKRSSRQLEEACWRDMAYRAVCGDLHPDHATIARFRAKIDDIIEDLFVEVLGVLADCGMIDTSLVALDGTRMGAVASKEANRSPAALSKLHVEARRILDEAAQADNVTTLTDTPTDADADADVGARVRGSSVARKATDKVRRAQRVEAAVEIVAEAEANRAVYEAKRQKPFKPVVNVTDLESRLQKTRGGFIQGYNAQSVVSSDQVVISCDVTADSTDAAQLVPMLAQSRDNIALAGVTAPIGVALADAGYASAGNFDAETGLGMCLLISTSKRRTVKEHAARAGVRAVRDRERIKVLTRIETGEITRSQAGEMLGLSVAWTGTLYKRWRDTGTLESPETLAWQAMTTRLTEPDNKTLYKHRSPLIEGSFAHIKTHRRTDTFIRHGLTACRAEWHLINIVGNIMKLHKKLATNRPGLGPNRSRHGFRPVFDVLNVPHRFSTRNRRNTPTTRQHIICRRVIT